MDTIAETAEKFGISKNALRYYEKEGLLNSVARDKNGIRSYSEKDLLEINKIVHLRKLGASLKEIKEFNFDEATVTSDILQKRIEFLERLDLKLQRNILEIKEQEVYLQKKMKRLKRIRKDLAKQETL
ncbi:MerR family transcriptional regulator [Listeria sp. FSL L7-1582]|uniref:MerR family transcriptional regulator n=1 Tax=Listeria portnoyi TaxID=2713504 RepID=UPI00164D8789|nr:MerR family transcriptional regulator [Listeria portnoyi]MBC6310473.1 MerR family transcriptional regulator [Listeria portnoyi]